MTDLLVIFAGTIVVGAFSSIALAMAGSQIIVQNKSAQGLFFGQAAVLAALICLWGLGPGDTAVTLATILAVVAVWAAESALARTGKVCSSETWYIGLFVLALALSYLITAVAPGLEAHQSRLFFGDLAMLPTADQWIYGSMSVVVLMWLIYQWRRNIRAAFDLSVLGKRQREYRLDGGRVILLAYIGWSVYTVGFTFVISCLFLPYLGAVVAGVRGRRLYTVVIAIAASMGTVCGFILSLGLTHIPTTPCIALLQLIFAWIIAALVTLAGRWRRTLSVTTTKRPV